MTKARQGMKNVPETTLPKAFLATGLVVTAGLFIFFLVALLGPKSASLLDASREFDTHNVFPPSIAADLPPGTGTALNNFTRGQTVKEPVNLDLTKGFILSDQDKRLSPQFQIPERLKKATALWFDLLTKYSSDSWIIVRLGPNPMVVEEWSNDKLLQQVGTGPSTSKVQRFLRQRVDLLSKTSLEPLRIQKGLREEFLVHVNKQRPWMPMIEGIFRAQHLPWELSRLFLVPTNISDGESLAPWQRIQPFIARKYLLENSEIKELESPLKVARALATAIKKKTTKRFSWDHFLLGNHDLDAIFYATLLADTYWKELSLEGAKPASKQFLQAFKLSRPTSAGNLTKQLKIGMLQLRKNNPDLINSRATTILPKSYVFFVAR